MNFADVDAQYGGQVILNPDNSRTANGGAILKNSANATAANLQVSGQNGYTYSVQIPEQNIKLTNEIEEKRIKLLKKQNGTNNWGFQKGNHLGK